MAQSPIYALGGNQGSGSLGKELAMIAGMKHFDTINIVMAKSIFSSSLSADCDCIQMLAS